MNKKAAFQPLMFLFLLIAIVALVGAFATKANIAPDQEDFVGFRSKLLLETYAEMEKIKYYSQKSLEFSSTEAMKVLYENGGYTSINNCQFLPEDPANNIPAGAIILNTCEDLTLEANFLTETREIFNQDYQPNYRSTRQGHIEKRAEFKQLEMFAKSRGVSLLSKVKYTFTNQEKRAMEDYSNAKLIEAETTSKEIIYKFSPFNLRLGDVLKGNYTLVEPKISVGKPDFDPFIKLYAEINFCHQSGLNKQECIISMQSNLPVAAVKETGSYLYVLMPIEQDKSYPLRPGRALFQQQFLKVAFDLNQALPALNIDQSTSQTYTL
jgi:hypothetical protein